MSSRKVHEKEPQHYCLVDGIPGLRLHNGSILPARRCIRDDALLPPCPRRDVDGQTFLILLSSSLWVREHRRQHPLGTSLCDYDDRQTLHPYASQPTQSGAPPRPPAVKGEVLAMRACGCVWLRSRCAPLTAVAASLLERCRLRRNAGLCLTRGMRGVMEGGFPPAPLSHPWTLSWPSQACYWLGMTDAENVLASMKGAGFKEM